MSKVAREGFVQAHKDAETVRDGVYKGIAPGVIKTASESPVKEKEEGKKPEVKEEEMQTEAKFSDKMTKVEAEANGFFKSAKPCGWGIYQVSDLDGGAGSVWYLEKGADGTEYLVKQVDKTGDVVRRAMESK